MDGRKEGRTDGRTEGGADGRTEEGRADERAEGRTDGRTDRQKDGRTEGRADGRKEGRSGEGHVLYGSALLPRRSKVQGEKPTGQAGGFGGRRHFNGDPSLPRRGFADLTGGRVSSQKYHPSPLWSIREMMSSFQIHWRSPPSTPFRKDVTHRFWEVVPPCLGGSALVWPSAPQN